MSYRMIATAFAAKQLITGASKEKDNNQWLDYWYQEGADKKMYNHRIWKIEQEQQDVATSKSSFNGKLPLPSQM